MPDHPLTRAAGVLDPERCQGLTGTGQKQCGNKAVPGQKVCPIHEGGAKIAIKREANRQYRLIRWRDRLSEFADTPEIKSLREEIGIARITLEEILNQCQGPNDILIYSDKIIKLVQSIDTLVTSCHKMEEKTGATLDKTKISQILDVVIQAITSQGLEPDVLENIQAHIEINLCQVLQISLSHGLNPVLDVQVQQTLDAGQLSTE